MRRALERRRITLAWLTLVVAICAPAAFGAAGAQVTLPIGPKPAAKGLRLALDFQWAQGYGYRPVRVEVTCLPPPVADRTLTVELTLASWSADQKFVTVVTDIGIPAGSASVSHVISVPQFTVPQTYTLSVSEDGSRIKELSVENQPLGGGGGYWGGDPIRILFVGSGTIDISKLDFLSHNPYGQNPVPARATDVATFDQRTTAELLADWINYTSLDLVFLSLADVQELAAKRPEAWQALRAWTRAGGNLCVFGVGNDWHGLEELEQLVGSRASGPAASGKYRGWETPSNVVFETHVVPEAAIFDAQLSNAQTSSSGVTTTAPATPTTAPAPPKDPPFVWRPAAFGMVVAIAEAQPFPGDSLIWRWMLESIGPARTRWQIRHGTVPDQDNPQFNDFLIADVGLPPIQTYRVLITLFVVAIGPVNYWLLRRRGRLHLFLFTVPAAALVTSAGLLGYALVADGLESRLRARSLTYLDQPSGEAVRHARLSYYTGLAPSGGLRFSDDTAILPLELSPSTTALRSRNRQLVWADGQYLTRGWLGSRMPTQYVTVRADKTRQALVPLPGDPAGVTVENRLGVNIRQLVWCDAEGKLHHGQQIPKGRKATLELLTGKPDVDAVLLDLSRALSQNGPAYPGTMTAFDSSSNWMLPNPRRFFNYAQNAAADTSQSLLETELARIKAAVLSQSLEPASYVAVVDRPPEVEAGTDGLNESQSSHVIYGKW